MSTPRYTIEYSIHEVTEDGQTKAEEVEGCTLSYAFTNFLVLLEQMYNQCDQLDNNLCCGTYTNTTIGEYATEPDTNTISLRYPDEDEDDPVDE